MQVQAASEKIGPSEPEHLKMNAKPKWLSRKVGIVTGCSGGIGRAIVDLLVQEGAFVVGADIDKNEGEKIEKLYPESFKFQPCDITNANDQNALLRITVVLFGRIDFLVNNAGASGSQKSLLEISQEDWSNTRNLIFDAPMRLTIEAIKHMKAIGVGGSIINIASIAGMQRIKAPISYSVAKGALIKFSKLVAVDAGQYNVRVNSVSPGYIPTNIYKDIILNSGVPTDMLPKVIERMNQASSKMQPIQRTGTASDVALACLYLAIPGYTTGRNIVVDGGYSLGREDALNQDANKRVIKKLLTNQAGL